jgi:hypothetical protein
MKGERGERWRQLCAQAAEEQDPDRLMELIREINDLLEEKEQRLKKQRASPKGSAAEA